MAEVDSYPICPTCEDVGAADDPAVEYFDEFAYLRSPAELDRFPIVATEERHRISVTDVLAEYDMPETMRCSMLPRSHPHRHGWVVRTRCGMVVKFGSECGENMVDGIERVKFYAKNARQFQSYVTTAPGRVRDLSERYAEATELERRVQAFRDRLRDVGGPFYQELLNTYAPQGSLGDSARSSGSAGAAMWDFGRPYVTRLGPRVRSLRDAAKDWDKTRPGLTRWREIFGEIKDLDDAIADFLLWARRAAQHMTREGMAEACRVIDSEWQDRAVEAFDPRSGRTVQRREQVFVRTRERFRVVDGGVEVFGRLLPILWP
jgi:hypothetical protein